MQYRYLHNEILFDNEKLHTTNGYGIQSSEMCYGQKATYCVVPLRNVYTRQINTNINKPVTQALYRIGKAQGGMQEVLIGTSFLGD